MIEAHSKDQEGKCNEPCLLDIFIPQPTSLSLSFWGKMFSKNKDIMTDTKMFESSTIVPQIEGSPYLNKFFKS